MEEKYNYSSKEEANGGLATTARGETFAEQDADHDVFGHEENSQVRSHQQFLHKRGSLWLRYHDRSVTKPYHGSSSLC